MNKNKLKALFVIDELKNGFLSDLLERVDGKIVSEFKRVGFINYGSTPSQKTWKISSLGQQYVKELKVCQQFLGI